MSEEKIIQHSTKALHALQDKRNGWGKKLKEFFLEIFIIVFAVSITLLLHNWNDARHERRLAREFLEGIKSDLDSGAVDLREAVAGFQLNYDYYSNVRKQILTRRYDAAYLDSNSWQLGNTAYFVFDMGRFEAFKSSGYLRLVENQTLLKHLMTLYTISIPFQVEADRGFFGRRKEYFEEHIAPRATLIQAAYQNDGIQASRLVDDPYFRYFVIAYSSNLDERRLQKLNLVRQMKEMSAEIAGELNK